MNKNILLTGSSGFIGSIVKNLLEKEKYNVIVINVRSYKSDKIFYDKIYNSIKSHE